MCRIPHQLSVVWNKYRFQGWDLTKALDWRWLRRLRVVGVQAYRYMWGHLRAECHRMSML